MLLNWAEPTRHSALQSHEAWACALTLPTKMLGTMSLGSVSSQSRNGRETRSSRVVSGQSPTQQARRRSQVLTKDPCRISWHIQSPTPSKSPEPKQCGGELWSLKALPLAGTHGAPVIHILGDDAPKRIWARVVARSVCVELSYDHSNRLPGNRCTPPK